MGVLPGLILKLIFECYLAIFLGVFEAAADCVSLLVKRYSRGHETREG